MTPPRERLLALLKLTTAAATTCPLFGKRAPQEAGI